MGRVTPRARKSAEALSNCRFSKEQPVFKALKNSSITHLARYISTIRQTCLIVSIGSVVQRIHSTGVSPSGGFDSNTRTTFVDGNRNPHFFDGLVEAKHAISRQG